MYYLGRSSQPTMSPFLSLDARSQLLSVLYLHLRIGEVGGEVSPEAYARLGDSVVDEMLQAGERAPADEEYVGRVHLDEV